MAEQRFRYYVPFLAYVAGPEGSFIVPGYEFYETSEPIETQTQVEQLRDYLNEHSVNIYSLSQKYIVPLDWKRIF